MAHTPVLLKEVIEGLQLKEGNVVLDTTVGIGGHALEICKAIGPRGTIIGLDEDAQALEHAKRRLQAASCSFVAIKENFRNLPTALREVGIRAVDRVLFDLGLRSDQLEESGRGFSFRVNEPLLMTFDSSPPENALTAYEIVNTWKEKDIASILKTYGEERFAKRIACGILAARKKHPIETTMQLVEVIRENVPARFRRGRVHVARKTFQALRIAVNDELAVLKEGLEKACERLIPGGRVAVITFHSLEDRIVKHFFREREKRGNFKIFTKKPIVPAKEELTLNPRSRSAKLRILEKLC